MNLIVVWDVSLLDEDFLAGDIILSFCSPAEEAKLFDRYPQHQIILARSLCSKLQSEAINDFHELLTKLSLIKLRTGDTVRKFFTVNDDSYWWYTPISFRQADDFDLFRDFLFVKVIKNIVKNCNVTAISFYSGPETVVRTFACQRSLTVTSKPLVPKNERAGAIILSCVLLALLARTKFLYTMLRRWFFIKLFYKPAPTTNGKKKIALSGFYDWSFNISGDLQISSDKYFKELPEALNRNSIEYLYFCWYDPNTVPGTKFSESRLLSALSNNSKYVILNQHCTVFNIIREYCNFFIHLYKLLKVLPVIKIDAGLFVDGDSMWPLLRKEFIKSALSSNIMFFELVKKAFKRQFEADTSVTTFLSFLEHFPFTRAVCSAAQISGREIDVLAMQHATHTEGKTFQYIDPQHEFNVSPVDNLKQPHPQKIFVMGQRNKSIFQSYGYQPDSVLLSGSSRYEQVKVKKAEHAKSVALNEALNILIPLSIKFDTHLDLIQAVYFASRHESRINITIRNHPFWTIQVLPWFKDKMQDFTFSTVSLQEDLDNTHLIVSSQSTVAEEAYFQGIPVIQWAALDFEGSPLAGDDRITSVASVEELKILFDEIQKDYKKFVPNETLREAVYRDYFHPSFAASENIALYIKKHVREKLGNEY